MQCQNAEATIVQASESNKARFHILRCILKSKAVNAKYLSKMGIWAVLSLTSTLATHNQLLLIIFMELHTSYS